MTPQPSDGRRRGLPERGSRRGVPDPRTISRVIYIILAIMACLLLYVLIRGWLA